MNVAFCAILLDRDPEHKKTAALLDSVKALGATHYVLGVDAKSIEGTEDWVRERTGGDVFSFVMEREDGVEDFARARNLTLDRVPEECDWWFWADADDTIKSLNGQTVTDWLSDMPAQIPAIACQYHYTTDEFGNVTTKQIKGRFYRRNVPWGWEWRNRVHEDCFPKSNVRLGKDVPFVKCQGEDREPREYVWIHDTSGRGTASDRNLRILRAMLKDDPDDARTWYYFGNQHFADRNFLEAIAAYDKYIAISGWPIEKYTALNYRAISYRCLGMPAKAIESDTQAMHLFPEFPDAYLGLLYDYKELGDWERGRYFGELGMQRIIAGTMPDTDVFINDNEYGFNPYVELAVCYFNLGDSENALRAYEQAAKQRPDPALLKTIDHLKWAMRRQTAIKTGLGLAGYLRDINEPLKAAALLDVLPSGASELEPVRQAKQMVRSEIAFLADPTAYRNHYFRNEEENNLLHWLEQPDAGMPRIGWVVDKLKRAGVKKILELGVGNAVTSLFYAKQGFKVVGVEVNPLAVKAANWNAVKLGFMGLQTITMPDDEVDETVPESFELPDMNPESKALFFCSGFDNIPKQVMDLGPFDAVVATELIEHVPDPEALLRACDALAPLVIISTPDGTWDGPQHRHSDHVRAYSAKELAFAIAPHGQILDLHKWDSGEDMAQNVMALYRVGVSSQQLNEQKSVVIYCPNTGQGWNPDSIKQGGIGGSETAVIKVAEEFVNRGYKVKVWAECEGIWNGVSYSFAEDFQPWNCDLFVSWRTAVPLSAIKGKAANRFLWSHDIHFGQATPEDLEGVTVLALSEFHKDFLEQTYPGATVVRSGNGIDPDRFEATVERKKHRLIYASSPDRGLDIVLKAFPEIKAKFPDATLDVYYGFEMAKQRIPGFVAEIERLARQDGVTLHGRINQEQLAIEYMRSDVMLYPSTMPNGQPFHETYCISAVEAQAAGCVPITPNWGALAETNCEGIQVKSVERLIPELCRFWSLPKRAQDETRQAGYMWAIEQTWAAVVDGWEALIAQPEAIAA